MLDKPTLDPGVLLCFVIFVFVSRAVVLLLLFCTQNLSQGLVKRDI